MRNTTGRCTWSARSRLQQFEAVAVGQHHVEHEEVGPEGRRLPDRVAAGARDGHLEAFVAQRGRDEVGDVRLVVDDEDARAQVGGSDGMGALVGAGHRAIVARSPVEMLCFP